MVAQPVCSAADNMQMLIHAPAQFNNYGSTQIMIRVSHKR